MPTASRRAATPWRLYLFLLLGAGILAALLDYKTLGLTPDTRLSIRDIVYDIAANLKDTDGAHLGHILQDVSANFDPAAKELASPVQASSYEPGISSRRPKEEDRRSGAVPVGSVAGRCPQHLVDGRACVLYGIGTCGKAAAEAILQASLETWAHAIPRERVIIVGGSQDDGRQGLASEPLPCDDGPQGFGCKEATMLYRAAARARLVGADWLVVGQEDKYIRTRRLERHLGRQDPSKRQVLAVYGCGRSWKFAPESAGGAKPRPKGWREPPFSCEAVRRNGSICGGGTYAVSRAALEALQLEGRSLAQFVEEMVSGSAAKGASDLMASCLFHKYGIHIDDAHRVPTVGLGGALRGEALQTAVLKKAANVEGIVFHISLFAKDLIPGVIRTLNEIDAHA
eukprot:TRINITY_DN11004_c0_g1_i1.p2 TRINITY_DN11004_c0_g1~~TRINITY_DN11004_c0_g1_i1.p2  ORF type:complete len:399 (-),score=96.29 TRINITY_DN11004_c0_g1_i1:70-1266(-)